MTSKKVTRPILRWFGGKWRLAPWIISHFPAHRVYVEPFGGAASVLLRKPRAYAEIYNDLDGEVVNLFRVMREQGKVLQDKIRLTPYSRTEFELSYQPSGDPLEQARRTIVRSMMGHGSNAHNKKTGFRVDSNCSGTSPGRDWSHYWRNLPAITERLQSAVLEARPALELINQFNRADTLLYVDPPYVQSARKSGEYRHELNDDDHCELAEALKRSKSKVALSGYDSELYQDLYSGWRYVTCRTTIDKALIRTEGLWMNYETSMLF